MKFAATTLVLTPSVPFRGRQGGREAGKQATGQLGSQATITTPAPFCLMEAHLNTDCMKWATMHYLPVHEGLNAPHRAPRAVDFGALQICSLHDMVMRLHAWYDVMCELGHVRVHAEVSGNIDR